MSKVKSILMAATIVLFAASCGGGSSSPAGITKAMYSQMQKGNYEKAIEILVDNLDGDKTPTAEEKAQFVKGFTEKAKQSADAKGGIKSFEIVSETISEDGESATVEVKTIDSKDKESTEKLKFVKKDGAWKISLGK